MEMRTLYWIGFSIECGIASIRGGLVWWCCHYLGKWSMEAAVIAALIIAIFPLIWSLSIFFGARGDLGIIHREQIQARDPSLHGEH